MTFIGVILWIHRTSLLYEWPHAIFVRNYLHYKCNAIPWTKKFGSDRRWSGLLENLTEIFSLHVLAIKCEDHRHDLRCFSFRLLHQSRYIVMLMVRYPAKWVNSHSIKHVFRFPGYPNSKSDKIRSVKWPLGQQVFLRN